MAKALGWSYALRTDLAGAGKVGWRDVRKGAGGGQHGPGKESDLQRNTEPGP